MEARRFRPRQSNSGPAPAGPSVAPRAAGPDDHRLPPAVFHSSLPNWAAHATGARAPEFQMAVGKSLKEAWRFEIPVAVEVHHDGYRHHKTPAFFRAFPKHNARDRVSSADRV